MITFNQHYAIEVTGFEGYYKHFVNLKHLKFVYLLSTAEETTMDKLEINSSLDKGCVFKES